MKKNILLVLFGMLIMAIIGVGVYAINADEITYNATTVESALDSLYTTQNNTVTNLTSENSTLTSQNSALNSQVSSLQERVSNPDVSFTFVDKQYSFGDLVPNRTVTKTLNKGKYLVVGLYSVQWHNSTPIETITTSNLTFSCDKNCVSTQIFNTSISKTPSAKEPNSDAYAVESLLNSTYYIDVKEDGTTITLTKTGTGTTNFNPTVMDLEVSKIED